MDGRKSLERERERDGFGDVWEVGRREEEMRS